MPVVFADPFGSFLDGFERGQDQRIQEEDATQQRRLREYDLYDTFVFSPNEERAREQRAFNQQISLMERRFAMQRTARAEAAAERAVDNTIARGSPRLNISTPGAPTAPAAPRAAQQVPSTGFSFPRGGPGLSYGN